MSLKNSLKVLSLFGFLIAVAVVFMSSYGAQIVEASYRAGGSGGGF